MRFRMRQVMVIVAAIAALLATMAPSVVRAADDVLQQVPDGALGFAVIHRLQATSDKVAALAQEIGAPIPNFLDAFRGATGANQGLDVEGHAMVAVLPGKPGGALPVTPIGFVPVTDYAAFLGQLEGDKTGQIATITLGGQTVLVTQRGSFAVFADESSRETLTQLRDAAPQPPAEVTAMSPWLVEQDAAIVVLPPGISMLSSMGIDGIHSAQESLRSQENQVPQMAQAIEALGMYVSFLEGLNTQVAAIGEAVRIDDGGNVHFASKCLAKPDSKFAAIAADAEDVQSSLVGDIPAGPFVLAGGMVCPAGAADALMAWSADFMMSNPTIYGLGDVSDEDMQHFRDAMASILEGVESMGFYMRPPEAGEPIFSNFAGVYRVANSAQFIDRYAQAMSDWSELSSKSSTPAMMKIQAERVQIGDAAAVKIAFDMSAAFGQQGVPPEAKQMFERIFGEGGKLTAIVAPIDDTNVIISYTDEEGAAKVAEAYRAAGSKLDADAGVARTAAMLPEGAQMVWYASVQGIVTFVQRVADVIVGPGAVSLPAFPEDAPPLGFALRLGDGGAQTDCVIPIALIRAGRAYAQTLGVE